MVEDIKAMLVEDVGRAEEGHHVEERVLVLMYQCRGRKRARQEMKGWGWSSGVETLESLQSQPPVNRKNFHLRRREKERG